MSRCYFVLGLFNLPVKQDVFRRPRSSLMQFHDPGVVTDMDTRHRYGWLTSRCTALCGGSQRSEWEKERKKNAKNLAAFFFFFLLLFFFFFVCVRAHPPPPNPTPFFFLFLQRSAVIAIFPTSPANLASRKSKPWGVLKRLGLVMPVSWSCFHHCAVREPRDYGFRLTQRRFAVGGCCVLSATRCP